MLLPEFENKGIGLFEITEAAVPAGTAAFAFKSAAHDLSACSTHDSVKTVRCAERVKNIVDTIFFALRALCRGTAQSSADPIGENANFKALIRKALKCVFLLGAALTSGMVGRMKNRR